MKKIGLLWIAIVVLGSGCCRLPICTEEVVFYRSDDLNDGRPAAVDIIYPRDRAELDRILTEIGPENWFTSELYDKVYKDKVWLDEKVVSTQLTQKDPQDPYMLIIAEFSNPDPKAPRGRSLYLLFEEEMEPKDPKKAEYIWIHDGSMERLRGRPDRDDMRRRERREERERQSEEAEQ